MAEPESQSSQPESNLFDNDFEKVEALGGGQDDLVSSSSPVVGEEAEEDLYTATQPMVPMVPEVAPSANPQPLLNFGDFDAEPMVSTFSDPFAQPQPAAAEPMKPTPAPAPAIPPQPQPSSPTKPAVTTASTKPATGSWFKNIDPREKADLPPYVLDLIYWRDPKKTGVVFGSMLILLLSLALFSVLSVVAYLSLAALTVTISFCIYKKVLGAVQKSGDGHPFKQFLDLDITIPEDKVHQAADHVVKHITCTSKELRRLFMVEDLVDSLKFGLLLWVLTYIGAWFNGMTLIILGVISIFTLPKFYETYKVQIDQYLDLARTQVRKVFKQIQEKIPLPGKKKAA